MKRLAHYTDAETIAFKDEGELNGEPIGPVTVVFRNGQQVVCGWFRIDQAIDIAERYGLALQQI